VEVTSFSLQCRFTYVLLPGCNWCYALSSGRVWRAMPNCTLSFFRTILFLWGL